MGSLLEADGGGLPVALPPLPGDLLVDLGEGLLAQRDPVPHLQQRFNEKKFIGNRI